MRIITLNERVPVTDAQARLVLFRPKDLQSLMLQNLGASIVEIGGPIVTFGAGYQVGVSEIVNFSWSDFSPKVRESSLNVEIYGICDEDLTASMQVYGFLLEA